MSICDVFEERAQQHPEARAYVFWAKGQSEDQLTYGELNCCAWTIAAHLQKICSPNARVLLLYPAGLEFVSAFWGCLCARVVAVPAPSPDLADLSRSLLRFKAMVKQVQPEVVLCPAGILSMLSPLVGQFPEIEALRWVATDTIQPGTADDWTRPSISCGDLAYLQYPSSTAGAARCRGVSYGALSSAASAVTEVLGSSSRSVGVCWETVAEQAGLFWGVIRPLWAGYPSVLLAPTSVMQSPLLWLEAVSRFGATTSGGPNLAYQACIGVADTSEAEDLDLSCWEDAYVVGDLPRRETLERFAEAFACRGFRREAFVPVHASAEAGAFVAGGRDQDGRFRTISVSMDALRTGRVEECDEARGRRLVGFPIIARDTTVIVAEPESDTACGPDRVGVICVSGPQVTTEYSRQAAATEPQERKFTRTSSLGFVKDGVLVVTGRLEDQLRLGEATWSAADIEWTVEWSHWRLVAGGGAAFSVEVSGRDWLLVVHEVERRSADGGRWEEQRLINRRFWSSGFSRDDGDSLDTQQVMGAIRAAVAEEHGLSAYAVVLAKVGGLPRISSGVVDRDKCKEAFHRGTLEGLAEWRRPLVPLPARDEASLEVLQDLFLPYVQAAVAKVLDKESPEGLDVERPLMELGLTSMLAVVLDVELRRLIGTDLETKLVIPITLVFNHPTITALAIYWARQLLSLEDWPDDVVHAEPMPLVPAVEEGTIASEVSPSAELDHAVAARLEEPIAVVGMACRLPCGIDDLEEYWRFLARGGNGITEVPPDRWDIAEYYDPDPQAPGKMYTRWGSFVDGADLFDTEFFSIPPHESREMDPQQRLLLEVGWAALEHAGLPPTSLVGSQTGVFVGLTYIDYQRLPRHADNPDTITSDTLTGVAMSIASGRLSYVLGLEGPSLSVDTACSSSLVAVHLACQSLRTRECDLALVGAASLMFAPEVTICLCKLRTLSPGSRCATFDAAADGFVRGEGCGVVVLKRLSDAVRDGSRILALIRGTAVNQDGRRSMLTAPNARDQELVVRKALTASGVEPAEVQLIEAHGTGTMLGDPIEVEALAGAMGGREHEKRVAVGSVKTNLGHLEAAAGIAALIKVVLALQHEEVPPHLHLSAVNPHIALESWPVVVPSERRPWPSGSGRRIAGVSAFGFNGTNAHVVLEEAPEEVGTEVTMERPLHVLTLSAKSEGALVEQTGRYDEHLAMHPSESLADVCFTANTGRTHFEHRLVIAADTTARARELLAGFRAGEQATTVTTGRADGSSQPKVALLFSGEGAEHAGMGRELYANHPVFRDAMDHCASILTAQLEAPLLSVMFDEGGGSALLRQSSHAQPALFALEYSLLELWRSWGVVPKVVMGHGMGEYVAALAAGVFGLEDGLRLVAERGRLIDRLPRRGQMVEVCASESRVAAAVVSHADQAAIAAVNGPDSVVLSGADEAIEAILEHLRAEGVDCRRLDSSHAFNSPLVDPLLEALAEAASTVSFSYPRGVLISNISGQMAERRSRQDRRRRAAAARGMSLEKRTAKEDRRTATAELVEVNSPEYWVQQSRETVRLGTTMETLRTMGIDILLESGPHSAMLELANRSPEAEQMALFASLRQGKGEWEQLLKSLSELYARGVRVDWAGFDRCYARHLVTLPTYPFDRQRYWFEDREARTRHPSAHPLLGAPLRSPLSIFESRLSTRLQPFLDDHRVYGMVVVPGAAYLEMALAASAEAHRGERNTVEEMVIHEALILEDEPGVMQLVLSPDGSTFQLFSAPESGDRPSWRLHATGRVQADTTEPEAASLEQLRARCPHEMTDEDFYHLAQAVGLEYGPSFQVVERLYLGEREVLGRVRLPEHLKPEADSYQLHPVLIDSCFQVMVAPLLAAEKETGAASSDAYFPVSVDSLRSHRGSQRPGTGRLWCHVLLQPGREFEREAAAADIRLFDDTGRVLAWMDGLYIKRASREALVKAFQKPTTRRYVEAVWRAKALLVEAGGPPQGAGRWLIFADQGGVGSKLATMLAEHGEACVTVTPGESFDRKREDHWEIDPKDPRGFERLVEHALGPTASWRGVVHLWGLDATPPEQSSVDTLRADQVFGSISVLHLVQALARAERPQPPLWLVTSGAEAVGEAVTSVAVGQASIRGLGRVVAFEHPELRCARVDLDPTPEADVVRALSVELLASDGEDEVAYRGNTRYVRRLAYHPMERRARSVALRPDGTYLVVGGIGGTVLHVARWMIEHGARHLVLVHDRSAPGDPGRVKKLQEQADIVVTPCDLSRLTETAALLRSISPSVRGIVYAAGTADDGLLLEQDRERLARMFSSTVEGAWNLHTSTLDMSLDFFLLWSSQAALVGLIGQAGYATATACLDALAHLRRVRGLTALSINWGEWHDADAAQAARQQPQAKGMNLLLPEEGLQAVDDLLGGASTQVGVTAINWTEFVQSPLVASVPPFLWELVPVEPSSSGEEGSVTRIELERQLEDASSGRRRKILIDFVRGEIARVLGVDRSALDPKKGLMDMGLSSLMAVQLRNALAKSMGQRMPATLAFNYPTIEAMADYLAGEVFPVETDVESSAEEAGGFDLESLLSEVEQLSSDEAKSALDKDRQ